MATALGDQRVTFLGVGWDGYQALSEIQGEKSRPQMIYLNGDVLLISPSLCHGQLNSRLGTFLRLVVVELDIPFEPTGATTFSSQEDEAGIQADDSFYFANYQVIATKDGQEEIDLRVDPPPDLVIEIIHDHTATKALEVLRRLAVREVWIGTPDGISFLALTSEGQYVESKSSLCLPFLTSKEIFEWVTRSGMASTTHWMKEVQRWARETLIPRREG